MRSAIYYPRTQVWSVPLMKSSLLLWDELHTIVPTPNYEIRYERENDLARAWELIGRSFAPNEVQKQRAHNAIETTLTAGALPANLYLVGAVDQPNDPYEVWPQKFAMHTWELLMQHKLAGVPLPNGDYPFTQEGGLLVMAKLADACAGKRFARVTDRLMAYGMIGSGGRPSASEADVVPVTLELVDASSLPIEDLIAFREREKVERRGSDYTKLRHAYADRVQAQIMALRKEPDAFQRRELERQFRDEMAQELKDLQEALTRNRRDLVMKPVIVASVVGVGSLAMGLAPATAAVLAGTAVVGANLTDVAKTVADFLSSGFHFSSQQRETMAKHPMAYMYALSSAR